ncbi:MAG: GH3 auxin-responsive promoter family protein, partial [Chloroflexota bacterium]|nr:GH3 auxin-responsive promoter family protein [Chloroflexota bacterium]
QLKQFTFLGRADDRIDMAGFTRLDEKTIWEALNASGLKFEEWTVRKEFETDVPVLHLFIEMREQRPPEEVRTLVDQKLKEVDPFYADLQGMLGIHPLRVTLLSPGAFDRFYDARRQAGEELGRLRPPHMNSTDADIADLLKAGG